MALTLVTTVIILGATILVVSPAIVHRSASRAPTRPRAAGAARQSPQTPITNEGLQGAGLEGPPNEPFAGGVETTLAGAEAKIGEALPRPDDPLASDASISQVWIKLDASQVYLSYGSGVSIFVIPNGVSPGGMDAKSVAGQDPNTMRVATVNGSPAVVQAGDFPGDCPPTPPATECAPPQHNPASVTFGYERFAIQILAPGSWSTATLLRIAGTVSAKGSA